MCDGSVPIAAKGIQILSTAPCQSQGRGSGATRGRAAIASATQEQIRRHSRGLVFDYSSDPYLPGAFTIWFYPLFVFVAPP